MCKIVPDDNNQFVVFEFFPPIQHQAELPRHKRESWNRLLSLARKKAAIACLRVKHLYKINRSPLSFQLTPK